MRARREHIPRKLLKRLAQEIGVSKSCARRATQFLKLRQYKTTIVHVRLAAARSIYQGLFFQLISTVCHRR
jgi:hypothetical protein